MPGLQSYVVDRPAHSAPDLAHVGLTELLHFQPGHDAFCLGEQLATPHAGLLFKGTLQWRGVNPSAMAFHELIAATQQFQFAGFTPASQVVAHKPHAAVMPVGGCELPSALLLHQ
jgi:hypothetical protein